MTDMLSIIDQMYATQINLHGASSGIGKALMQTARGVAGIAGFSYIGVKLANQILRGEGINFIPLLRPFALVILIGFLPNICTLIDNTFKGIAKVANADNAAVKAKVAELQVLRTKVLAEKWKNIEQNEAAYSEIYGEPDSNSPILDGIKKSFNITIGKMTDEIKAALFDFTQSILMLLGDIAYVILYLISVVYRLILRVIAPLAIAVSIFDGFSNNFLEWIGKYVNYALLPTVAAIYQNIAVEINMQFMQSMIDDPSLTTTLSSQDPFSFGLIYTGVLVVLLVIYTQIPSITNMIIVVGGTSGIIQGLTAKVSAGARASSVWGGFGARGALAAAYVGSGAIYGSVKAATSGTPQSTPIGLARGAYQGSVGGFRRYAAMNRNYKNLKRDLS